MNDGETIKELAVNIYSIFSELTPTLPRARNLSLNAIVTSARHGTQGLGFGMVSNELNVMVSDMEELLNQVVKTFSDISVFSGQKLQEEMYMQKVLQAEKTIKRSMGENPTDKAVSADHRQSEPQPESQGGHEKHNLDSLSNSLQSIQGKLSSNHQLMNDLLRKEMGLLNQLSWLVAQKGHFISISAKIEAARFDEKSADLRVVAQDIRQLSQDIKELVEKTKDNMSFIIKNLT
ncbi:MAG: hypothetical protein OEZ59_10390 [Deltaproteobacteria bacterium]|nr:hypothetical protein [Deltaproteobacteria bacterium]